MKMQKHRKVNIFGALLLKYIERSLSDGDIDKLITFTNNYNTLYDSMSNIKINDNGM